MLLALMLWPVSLSAGPVFERVDAPNHIYAGGWEHFVGGGVAVFDCDGDHLPELFVAGGTNPARLLRNRTDEAGTLAFSENTPETLALKGVTGAYPVDLDGDGILDLVTLRVGENAIFRGGADCTFESWRLPGLVQTDAWTTAFSATWEAGRDWPTLAFGNYVDRTDPDGPFEACDSNVLFRHDGQRYGATSLEPGFCPLSALFSDWDRDGRADLRLSNDRHYYVRGGAEQMWVMGSEPRLLSEDDGWIDHELWGMGIASRDLDFDGLPEVFLTSMGDQRLQRLVSRDVPRWEDVPYEMGTTAHRPHVGGDGRPSTGWHVAFGDVQNDGLDDVFIAKGNVDQMPGSAMDDPNSLLIQEIEGKFVEMAEGAGIATMDRSRGAAMVDLDMDGLLDLVVVNRRAPLEVYRNATSEAGNWLSIELRQDLPNTRAVGGFLEIDTGDKVFVREITVGGGHAGGSAGPEHFGLGSVETVRLRVVWPDGIASDWIQVPANQNLTASRDGSHVIVRAY